MHRVIKALISAVYLSQQAIIVLLATPFVAMAITSAYAINAIMWLEEKTDPQRWLKDA